MIQQILCPMVEKKLRVNRSCDYGEDTLEGLRNSLPNESRNGRGEGVVLGRGVVHSPSPEIFAIIFKNRSPTGEQER